MYKVIVFIPEDSKEKVKKAMFNAGAGQIGNYSHCSFEMKGMGQFLPTSEANPTIGKADILEYVAEYKVEMVVEDEKMLRVIKAMKESHPYEEPAFDVFKQAFEAF